MSQSRIAFRLAAAFREVALGIPAARGVMLSWRIEGGETVDLDAGVSVAVARTPEALADPERIDWFAHGVRGAQIRYAGPALASRDVRYWTVSVRLADGTNVTSPPARFEIGLERLEDWSSDWISAPLQALRREQWDPLPLFRQEFDLPEIPESGRVYATALGLYRLWINGVEVTDDALLRPGWTDYRFRVLHQTFDATPYLCAGRNAIAVELSRGWYAGRVGLQREPALYGEQPALRLQLETGDRVVAASGAHWRYGYGEVIQADLLTGETHDQRQAQRGWTEAGFDDAAWSPVQLREVAIPISPQPHEHVRGYEEHEGVLVRAHARGPAVFDFGQNIVGWTRLETHTLPKADVIVRHGEILTPDQLVWRDNLRGAFQEDRYTTGDDEHHVLEPRHTLHGFRFAEVWNLPSQDPYGALELRPDTRITARSVTGQQATGSFACSDEALTKVAKLVEWTARDNMIEVITDCPQRDERLGWLGDAGVIAESAAYHLDLAAFVGKFARDAADSQSEDGAIRSYVPPVPPGVDRDGAPGWADGYVRLVHLAAERYGDLATAQEHYGHVARYLAWVDAANPDGIRTARVGSDFSDWLSLPEDASEPPHPGYAYTGARSTSSKRVIATAHTIRSWDQFAEIAEWLGHNEDATRARRRAEEIRETYAATFVNEEGWIEGDTQTAYAQAIGYGILRGKKLSRAVARLAEKVKELGHVTVGIHGSEHIVPALARHGHVGLAEALLLREEMPSWKHMVAMGATTIWEKWDGIAADGKMSTAEMNSFNHCALGAIGEFLFEGVAGLNARAIAHTRTLRVAPVYFDRLDWARAEHDSAAGPVKTAWRRTGGGAIVHEITPAPGIAVEFVTPTGYRVISRAVADSGSTVVHLERE
ncbi:family 78 glycoside hydrolase catalytic domain [Microbacterium esteraromaticum]|uniref:family 78 glycoside hydrolase catalytic domain n=1 Tax=Microbacterium esteraromaticum TaxID=57043 RepID=UPI001C94F784|nr:family 78 glycoside hydrolase catalytic domain [Microbacterium esteraromaticum]MBY6061002.1 glycoside hydrolase family 78 protein [Microbacterium esteraromaticum]